MDIEIRGISKRFGPVQANQDIDLDIRAGEVLGLLGENGAGKSTLMNVLSGLYRPDSGEIVIDGTAVSFDGPGDSIAAGIGMVHQHFMLVPVFSVVENVILGVEPTGQADYLDLDAARAQVQQINDDYGMEVPSDALIEDLPVGIQQRVEILKVLFRSADVLILDEPTAVLTPQEVEAFFGIVRALRDAGKAIVFITHKLHEILEIADRVSVLRQGRIVGHGVPSEFSEADLAEMMVGRPVSFSVGRTAARPGDPVLELAGISLLDAGLEARLQSISMSVRAGEIVGVAGVQGNGQTELVEAITGLASVNAGRLTFNGSDITTTSVRQRQMQDHRQAGEAEGGNGGGKPAHHHLPLGPDIEQPGTKGQADAKPGHHQRDRGGQRLGDGVHRAERALRHGHEAFQDGGRRHRGRHHDHRADDKRQEHRRQRNQDNLAHVTAAGDGGRQQFAKAAVCIGCGTGHAASILLTPAMARPMALRSAPAFSLSNSAVMRPSNMT